MKFTIGNPNPRSAKPPPVIVKLAGGVARSTVLGLMPLTPGPAMMLKVAVTACAALTVTLQVPVPAQLPLQPVKAEPIAGAAVKVTAVPEVEGGRAGRGRQEMPAGALVTVPLPVPAVVTVRANEDCMNVAVTDVAAFSVTVQALVPVQPPLQPLKVEPATGMAVKVTAVPLANAAEHVAPHVDAGGRAGDGTSAGAGFGQVSVKV